MKYPALLLLVLFGLVAPSSAYVPTSDMSMSWKMSRDTRKWVPKYQNGSRSGIIFELTPEGQSIDAWREMVAQQIDFTKLSLEKHFAGWKEMLRRADPKIVITEKKLPDGSILATYESAATELSVRRFIKAKDGVYMLAYHVRPQLKDETIWALWTEIVSQAELVPNPEKRR